MGGFGSGGTRVGSGAKRKDAATAALHGSRQRAARAEAASRAGTGGAPVVVDVPMPEDLPEDQQAVWRLLAPHALAAKTLTPGTVESFRDLCRAVTIQDQLLAEIKVDGWRIMSTRETPDGGAVTTEIKKHPLIVEHRGWAQRVEAGRARFRLAPIGKEITTAEPPADPFAEFDTPTHGGH